MILLFLGVSFIGEKESKTGSELNMKVDFPRLSSTSSFANTLNMGEFQETVVSSPMYRRFEVRSIAEEPYTDTWEGLQAYFNDRKELFLHWSTTSNYPTDHFEIEKGRTLGTYTVLGTIESIRNPGMLRLFSYVDTTIQKGSTFYRIKKIKPNGDSTFSKVLQVHIP